MSVRTAIIGLGWWGQTHVKSMTNSTKMNITRAVDPDTANCAPIAEGFGLPFSADYGDVLTDPNIDAVILATPHDQHTEQIIAAAEAGKHVFTEKPFALSQSEAERQVAACRATDVQLGIGLIQRFVAPHLRIKEMIAAGELGVLMHGDATTSHDVLLNVTSWRKDPAQAPTGGIHHTGTHLIDLYVWMFGPVKKVYGQRTGHIFENDTATAILTFDGGQTAVVTNVMATADRRYFHISGSEGAVTRTSDTSMTYKPRGGTEEVIEFPPSNEVCANNEAFADAVMGNAPYPITTDEMIHNVAILDAIKKSMETAEVVEVGP